MKTLIIITTYHRPDKLSALIDSLENVQCLVIDDGSPFLPELPDWVHVIRNKTNGGKQDYWKRIQQVMDYVKNHHFDYYIQIPDDVTIEPGFVERAIELFTAIKDRNKICLNLLLDRNRIGKPNWTGFQPEIQRFGETSVYKTQWVDLCYIATAEFFEALNFRIDPIHPDRWKHNKLLGSGVGQQISNRLKGYNMYQVKEILLHHGEGSIMNQAARKIHPMKCETMDEIHCGVASIPGRKDQLGRTIASILPFVDHLYVYLNEYDELPWYLNNPKIQVFRSQDHGNLGDAGKFFNIGKVKGYYLSIDDDIIYPRGYVWKLIHKLDHYGRCAVGVHGKQMKPNPASYYKGHGFFAHCRYGLDIDTPVHILGTGTLAFHTDSIKLEIGDFEIPNMADIWFGIQAQKQELPLIAIDRQSGWIQVQHLEKGTTIYEKHHNKDWQQTEIYNSWNHWKLGDANPTVKG